MVFLAHSLVLILAQASATAAGDPKVSVDLDKAVLQVVADNICRNTKRGYSVLSSNAAAVSVSYGDGGMNPALVRAVIARNKNSPPLPTGIGCERLRMADAALIERTFSSSTKIPVGWEAFYAAFPDSTGVTRLSLPSYSSSLDEALVYVSGECASLCGSGFYWHLRKIDDKWKVVAIVNLWIA
jgi:hypothetical protein